jgi:hypothetical protein
VSTTDDDDDDDDDDNNWGIQKISPPWTNSALIVIKTMITNVIFSS